jgi:hypothetical protein
VNGGGAWDDMPIFPRPAADDPPPVGDPILDALLARAPLPESSPRRLHSMAYALAELSTAPVPEQPGAEARALAAFRGTAGRKAVTHHPRPRRRPVLTSLLTAKLTAKLAAKLAAAALAAGVGGAAAAGYAGVLPAPVQKLAHDTIGAPARPPTRPAPTPPAASPARPAASPPGQFGLCTAYASTRAHGSAAQRAVAFRRLAAAAGGAGKVAAYCAAVPHPGPSTAGHPTGQPGTLPTPAHATHRPGRPTGLPTPAQPSHPQPSHPQPSHPHPGHTTGQPASHQPASP